MSGGRIKDLPQHREAIEQAKGLEALGKLVGVVAPILPKSARDAIASSEFAKVGEVRAEMERLASLPDRFNDHFAKRGWIAFAHMDASVMEEAAALADAGKADEAEAKLAEFWAIDMIRTHINWLKPIAAFPSRWRLAVDAEELYGQGKYHASTLMVLAILDGVVQETSARHLGINQNFSAEKTVLEAWDSIAAHSSGLSRLKELMLEPRHKTNTDPITIPHRHGIVHGMDVNFNSRLVAAKAWAALFAVGEWALLAQKKQLEQPPPKPEKGLLEQLKDTAVVVQRNERLKRAGTAFKPRTLWQEGKIPRTGKPADYGEGTPERAVVEFLSWWQTGNYGHMANATRARRGERETPQNMRDWFGNKTLHAFELTNVVDNALVRSTVTVQLTVKDSRGERQSTVSVTLIKETEDGEPAVLESGNWLLTTPYEFAFA